MNPSGTILEAGDYVVELAFSRVCDPEVLRRALTAMGWSNIIFDETPAPSTGALPSSQTIIAPGTPRNTLPPKALGRVRPGVVHKGLGLATAPKALGRVTVASPPKALGRVPSAATPGKALGRVVAPKALGRVGPHADPAEIEAIRNDVDKFAAMTAAAVARNSPAAPGLVKRLAEMRANLAAKGLPGGSSQGPLTCENIDKLDQAAWDAMTPADRNFYNQCLAAKAQTSPGGGGGYSDGGGSGPSPGGGGGGPSPGGGGGGGGGEPAAPPQEPAPEPMPEPAPPAQSAAQEQPAETPAAAPLQTTTAEDPLQVLVRALQSFTPGAPPTEPLPNETADIRTLRLQNLWRRWSEWGSPFSVSPGGGIDDLAMSKVQISGEGDSDPCRLRFVGHLDTRIRLVDPPGMQLVFVKPIHLGYDEAIRFHVEPHRLNPGAFYEFRVLVRDKTAPTRSEVKRRLGAMGFAPMKLHLLKRNIHLPNRPSSLSMWYGMGQWLHPSTVVTVEDPFYFEQVKEIAP
jgi:hypothetical protein